jgi:hypothetical protein
MATLTSGLQVNFWKKLYVASNKDVGYFAGGEETTTRKLAR